MKREFVRIVSLVGALALPAGLVAQASPAPTTEKSTTSATTTQTKSRPTDKGMATKTSKKRRHHHKKTTQTQSAKPSSKK
jgi:hypothetical protein